MIRSPDERRVPHVSDYEIVATARTNGYLCCPLTPVYGNWMSFEFCRLVLDRPSTPCQGGLVYLAETISGGVPRVVASSAVFRPDIDMADHDAARAEIEALLKSDGWQRVPDQPMVVVGLRFQRPVRVAPADQPTLLSAV